MHYRNGREAKEGDFVIGKFGWPEAVRAGMIHSLNPGATSCNGMVTYPIPGQTTMASVTVGDLVHAEDAFNAFRAPAAAQPELSIVNTEGNVCQSPETTDAPLSNAA